MITKEGKKQLKLILGITPINKEIETKFTFGELSNLLSAVDWYQTDLKNKEIGKKMALLEEKINKIMNENKENTVINYE